MFRRRAKLSDEELRREIDRKELESLHRRITRPRSEWLGHALVALLLVSIIFGPVTVIIVKSRWGIDEVLSSRPVGELVDSHAVTSDWLEGPQTRVETTEGVFYVRGRFQGVLGTSVTLQKRGNGYWYLCASEISSCRRL